MSVKLAVAIVAALACTSQLARAQAPPSPQSTEPPRAPDIYFAATTQAVAVEMLELANTGPADLVFDLGSGDGRIVILAAQRFGARGVGVEIDAALVDRARQVAREAGVDGRVAFRQEDFFRTAFADATVVTLYLSPSINSDLEPRLRRELRPGTRIVSHQFPIGRWEPDRVVRASDGTSLYLWILK